MADKVSEREAAVANLLQSAADSDRKRKVISQEETESAVNALLGESFDSFEGASDPTNQQQVENMDVTNVADDKRMNEEWQKMEAEKKKQELVQIQGEADTLAHEAKRSELSIDELTTLRQLEADLTYQQQVEKMHFSYIPDDESVGEWYAGKAKKKRKKAKARIQRHEMTTFMLCPVWDELVIVKCDKCEECVKIEAFGSHMTLRHGSKSEPGDTRKVELPEDSEAEEEEEELVELVELVEPEDSEAEDEEEELVELPPLVYIRGNPWQPIPSPPLEPMVTSEPMVTLDPSSSSPQIVTEKTDSISNNVISIPDTATDMANSEIISDGQSLLDAMESSLPTPAHFTTVSPLPKPSSNKKLALGRMVQPPVSHPAPSSSVKKSKKVAMEQRRQKQMREQQSNLSLFASAWTEENSEELRTSKKRVFGEDLGRSGGPELRGGGAAVPHPLKLRLLKGVPHPPQRRQLWQLPRRQIEIPLHSNHEKIIEHK